MLSTNRFSSRLHYKTFSSWTLCQYTQVQHDTKDNFSEYFIHYLQILPFRSQKERYLFLSLTLFLWPSVSFSRYSSRKITAYFIHTILKICCWSLTLFHQRGSWTHVSWYQWNCWNFSLPNSSRIARQSTLIERSISTYLCTLSSSIKMFSDQSYLSFHYMCEGILFLPGRLEFRLVVSININSIYNPNILLQLLVTQ